MSALVRGGFNDLSFVEYRTRRESTLNYNLIAIPQLMHKEKNKFVLRIRLREGEEEKNERVANTPSFPSSEAMKKVVEENDIFHYSETINLPIIE